MTQTSTPAAPTATVTGTSYRVEIDGQVIEFRSSQVYRYLVVTTYRDFNWYVSLRTSSANAAQAKVSKLRRGTLATEPGLDIRVLDVVDLDS